MDGGRQQQISMLRILHAACATALDSFHRADEPIDAQLVGDVETMMERVRRELDRLHGADV